MALSPAQFLLQQIVQNPPREEGAGDEELPGNALTLNGEALTLNGEIMTLGEAE